MLGASRAELFYLYEFEEKQYSGRVVRDFRLGSAEADSLVYDNHPGEKLSIVIDRDNPEISYYPSGFGSLEPMLVGLQSLFAWAVVVGVIRLIVLTILHLT